MFLLSLGVGILMDGSFNIKATAEAVKDYQGAIIAAIAGSSIPLGYLISLFSISITRELFRHLITKPKSFEDPLTSALSDKLWSRVPTDRRPDLDLSLHVIYSFHVISEPVRSWIDRRWSTFVTSINLMGALVLAPALGYPLGIRFSAAWFWFSLVVFFLGFWSARIAFHQVRSAFEALLMTEDGCLLSLKSPAPSNKERPPPKD